MIKARRCKRRYQHLFALRPLTSHPLRAGLRALLKKEPDALRKLIDREEVDILCLQETKLQGKHTADMADTLAMDGWALRWNCSTGKLGYSGVAMFYRKAAFASKPTVREGIGSPEHDEEGRVLTLETDDMCVVNAYVPNAGAPRPHSRFFCYSAGAPRPRSPCSSCHTGV